MSVCVKRNRDCAQPETLHRSRKGHTKEGKVGPGTARLDRYVADQCCLCVCGCASVGAEPDLCCLRKMILGFPKQKPSFRVLLKGCPQISPPNDMKKGQSVLGPGERQRDDGDPGVGVCWAAGTQNKPRAVSGASDGQTLCQPTDQININHCCTNHTHTYTQAGFGESRLKP